MILNKTQQQELVMRSSIDWNTVIITFLATIFVYLAIQKQIEKDRVLIEYARCSGQFNVSDYDNEVERQEAIEQLCDKLIK
jgi:hypothetical protein